MGTLRSVILITQAEVQGESGPDAPLVVSIQSPFFIKIGPLEVRRGGWTRDGTARNLALRVVRHLKQLRDGGSAGENAGQCFRCVSNVSRQIFRRILKRRKKDGVLDVY